MHINEIYKLSDTHETPFYVYDIDRIQYRIKRLRSSLPFFNLLYSVKSNPNIDIIRCFANEGIGFDVASISEMKLVRRFGFSDVYYSAPGKKIKELENAVDQCNIIADSIGELSKINSIAKNKDIIINVGVRINIPNDKMTSNVHEVMGGISSKFGIDYSDIVQLKSTDYPGIRINGIHVYFGSQILDLSLIKNNFSIIAKVAIELKKKFDIVYVNFGGGFGIPYKEGEKEIDLDILSSFLLEDSFFNLLIGGDMRLNLELGRFLVADSGYFVSSIIDIKKSFDQKYVIIDGGMHSFYRPIMTGDYHSVIQRYHNGKKEEVKLVGRLCTPIDKYYDRVALHDIAVGDILIFENAGAYGKTMSLSEFISYEAPEEVIIGGEFNGIT